MSVLERFLCYKGVCIGEVSVLERCLYRDVCIRKMCVLARFLYLNFVCIRGVFVQEMCRKLSVLERCL
jgi:hypothetical protein